MLTVLGSSVVEAGGTVDWGAGVEVVNGTIEDVGAVLVCVPVVEGV